MEQKKFICLYCGKEFYSNSKNRKYCCRECANNARKGKSNTKNSKEKVKVTCIVCGKEEYLCPSKAKNYKTCCKECHKKYYSSLFNKQIECHCETCGKVFYLKPYAYNRNKHHCCSVKCLNKLKETLYLGSGNHQFGLKGELNVSFKGGNLTHKNGKIWDQYIYDSDYPDPNDRGFGRVTVHRYNVWKNNDLYDPIFFYTDSGGTIHLKSEILVHHINCDHSDNNITNLLPLTRKQHTKVHNNILLFKCDCFDKIIGVVKLGELLENLGEDNQQPSLSSNTFEGSETNSRIQLDSNADTSALLNEINKIIDDYIVQTEKITRNAYEASIKEISESKIKSLE